MGCGHRKQHGDCSATRGFLVCSSDGTGGSRDKALEYLYSKNRWMKCTPRGKRDSQLCWMRLLSAFQGDGGQFSQLWFLFMYDIDWKSGKGGLMLWGPHCRVEVGRLKDSREAMISCSSPLDVPGEPAPAHVPALPRAGIRMPVQPVAIQYLDDPVCSLHRSWPCRGLASGGSCAAHTPGVIRFVDDPMCIPGANGGSWNLHF